MLGGKYKGRAMTVATHTGERTAESPAAQVEAASHALMNISVRSLTVLEGKVSMPQFRALTVLDEAGPLNVGVLAEELRIGVSSVSRMCDRLVAAGLVDRGNPPHSRREIVLTLTPAAGRLLRSVATRRRSLIAETMAAMPEDGQRALLTGLTGFAAAVEGDVQNC